ncbi:MAG: DUF2784 domain-containing protein [Arenicellales bacterium]|nr:DUF2784 domain-containing protein [Arenicellales bacterium]
MLYRVLADVVVFAHFIFIVYAVLGGMLVMKWRWTAYLHIPVFLWGVLIEAFGWICPLTPLENDLRTAAGLAGYSSSFIDHYLIPIVYPENLTRPIQWLLAGLLLLINGVVYGIVVHKYRRSKI